MSDREENVAAIMSIAHANNQDAASCSLSRQSKCNPVFPRRLLRKENRCSDGGGSADQISNTAPDERKLPGAIVPFPDRTELQAPERFRNSIGRPQRTLGQLRDATGNSQTCNLARPCQGFLQRNTLNPSGLQFRNTTAGFGFPGRVNRSIKVAMPNDQNAIHEFRHHFAGHLPRFFNNLIQCHRHRANLTCLMHFGNVEAGIEQKRPENFSQSDFVKPAFLNPLCVESFTHRRH